jgi:hypothetical protein
MADIDLYNSHVYEWSIAGILETRIFNTAMKLRAFGFIEETKPPDSTQDNHAKNHE